MQTKSNKKTRSKLAFKPSQHAAFAMNECRFGQRARMRNDFFILVCVIWYFHISISYSFAFAYFIRIPYKAFHAYALPFFLQFLAKQLKCRAWFRLQNTHASTLVHSRLLYWNFAFYLAFIVVHFVLLTVCYESSASHQRKGIPCNPIKVLFTCC